MSQPPKKNPAYPPHTPLFEMIRDQWSRQLNISQVIGECEASGFKIDYYTVYRLFDLFTAEMEKNLLSNSINIREIVREGAPQSVRDLLAVIHGDGGHYTAEHGFEKSAVDARRRVESLMRGPTVTVERGLASMPWVYVNGVPILCAKAYLAQKVADDLREALSKRDYGMPPGAE